MPEGDVQHHLRIDFQVKFNHCRLYINKQYVKYMSAQKPHIIIRVFLSGVLGLFAFVPSFYLIYGLIKIFNGEAEVRSIYYGVTLSISLLIALALAYYLWLLSWRALTGKSRRVVEA